MRFNYKIIPAAQNLPTGHPQQQPSWVPVIPIRLSYGHGPQTKRFEALIDSGAPDCLFSADIAAFLKIKIESGTEGFMGGLVQGPKVKVHYHYVNLWVGAEMIRIKAAFASGMSAAAILGRRGFFENFIIKFDPTLVPPGFEITRVVRD